MIYKSFQLYVLAVQFTLHQSDWVMSISAMCPVLVHIASLSAAGRSCFECQSYLWDTVGSSVSVVIDQLLSSGYCHVTATMCFLLAPPTRLALLACCLAGVPYQLLSSRQTLSLYSIIQQWGQRWWPSVLTCVTGTPWLPAASCWTYTTILHLHTIWPLSINIHTSFYVIYYTRCKKHTNNNIAKDGIFFLDPIQFQ